MKATVAAGLIAAMAAVWLPAGGGAAAAENEAAQAARTWRQQHERAILEEDIELLRIPNVSRDRVNVRRNAEHILTMMERPGLAARLLDVPDASPTETAPPVDCAIATP